MNSRATGIIYMANELVRRLEQYGADIAWIKKKLRFSEFNSIISMPPASNTDGFPQSNFGGTVTSAPFEMTMDETNLYTAPASGYLHGSFSIVAYRTSGTWNADDRIGLTLRNNTGGLIKYMEIPRGLNVGSDTAHVNEFVDDFRRGGESCGYSLKFESSSGSGNFFVSVDAVMTFYPSKEY